MDFSAHPPEGIAFKLMGTPHLVSLAVVLAINLLLLPLRRVVGEAGKRAVRYGLVAVLVGSEGFFHLWRVYAGLWNVQENLSLLHLCGLMIWVSAAALLTRNPRLYEFVYFLGVGGATQALLTPDVGPYGYPHIRFYACIVTHAAIVTTGMYLIVVERFRPTWASVRRVVTYTPVYMAFVGVANALLGSNYMFIARKPEFPSLLDMLGPWPWYVVSLIGVGLLFVLLMHLPFALAVRRTVQARGGGPVHLE